jgi:hypothetical protein
VTERTIDGTDFDQKMAFVSKKPNIQLITPLLYPTIHTCIQVVSGTLAAIKVTEHWRNTIWRTFM